MARNVVQQRPIAQAPPEAKPRHKMSRMARQEAIAGYAFLLPNLIGFMVFSFLPILAALALTLTEWNVMDTPKFVGLENFQKIAHDDLFWKTAFNTLYYTLGAVPIGVFIAFWLALLLNRKMGGVVFFRTVFFLPSVTLGVAIAMVWIWLYHPELGLINYGLAKLGIDGPSWLQSTRWAMPALIIMNNWVGIGGAMLIYLAGLQAIPEEYYEAARIDGATYMQQLRYITVPLISPTTFFVLRHLVHWCNARIRLVLCHDARRTSLQHDATRDVHIPEWF